MGNLQPGRAVAAQRKAAAYPWCTAAAVLSDVEDEGGTIEDIGVAFAFSFKKRKWTQISKRLRLLSGSCNTLMVVSLNNY